MHWAFSYIELTTDTIHVHFNFLPIVLYLFSIGEVNYMEKHLTTTLYEFIGLTLLPKHLSTKLFLLFIREMEKILQIGRKASFLVGKPLFQPKNNPFSHKTS